MYNQTSSTVSNLSVELKIFLSILSTITSVCTVLGNLLVIFSFFVERALRTSSNYLIASLAVTDFIIGVLSMNIYTAYLLLGVWPFGRFICDLWLSLDYSVCLVSQYTVFTITFDRFCSVKFPARYKVWRTESKIRIIIGIIWIIPLIIFFVIIMAWSKVSGVHTIRSSNECYAEFAKSSIFNILFTIGYYWITLIVITGLYFAIYLVALNLEKKSKEQKERIFKFVESNQIVSDYNSLSKLTNNMGNFDSLDSIQENNYSISSPIAFNNDINHVHSKNSSHSSIFYTAPNSLSSLESFHTAKMIQIEINTNTNENNCHRFQSEKTVFSNFIARLNLKRKNLKVHINLSPIVQSSEISNTTTGSLTGENSKKDRNKTENDKFMTVSSTTKTFGTNRSKSVKARKALRTIALIIGAFFITWTPYHILVLVKSTCDDHISKYSCVNEDLYNFSYWLCYLNSPINPFCYALVDKQFKITFKKILHL